MKLVQLPPITKAQHELLIKALDRCAASTVVHGFDDMARDVVIAMNGRDRDDMAELAFILRTARLEYVE